MRLLVIIDDIGILLHAGRFVSLYSDWSDSENLDDIISEHPDHAVDISHLEESWDLDLFHQDNVPDEIWKNIYDMAVRVHDGHLPDAVDLRQMRSVKAGLRHFLEYLSTITDKEEYDVITGELVAEIRTHFFDESRPPNE